MVVHSCRTALNIPVAASPQLLEEAAGGGGVVISDRLSLCCNNSNSHFIVFRSASLEDAAGVRICSNYLLFQLSALSVDVFLS